MFPISQTGDMAGRHRTEPVRGKGVAGARLGVGVKAPALVTGIDCYDEKAWMGGYDNPSGEL